MPAARGLRRRRPAPRARPCPHVQDFAPGPGRPGRCRPAVDRERQMPAAPGSDAQARPAAWRAAAEIPSKIAPARSCWQGCHLRKMNRMRFSDDNGHGWIPQLSSCAIVERRFSSIIASGCDSAAAAGRLRGSAAPGRSSQGRARAHGGPEGPRSCSQAQGPAGGRAARLRAAPGPAASFGPTWPLGLRLRSRARPERATPRDSCLLNLHINGV
jgi:hypothetical protein